MNVAGATFEALHVACYVSGRPETDCFKQPDNPAVHAILRMLELAADWLNSSAPWIDSELDASKEGTSPGPVVMLHT